MLDHCGSAHATLVQRYRRSPRVPRRSPPHTPAIPLTMGVSTHLRCCRTFLTPPVRAFAGLCSYSSLHVHTTCLPLTSIVHALGHRTCHTALAHGFGTGPCSPPYHYYHAPLMPDHTLPSLFTFYHLPHTCLLTFVFLVPCVPLHLDTPTLHDLVLPLHHHACTCHTTCVTVPILRCILYTHTTYRLILLPTHTPMVRHAFNVTAQLRDIPGHAHWFFCAPHAHGCRTARTVATACLHGLPRTRTLDRLRGRCPPGRAPRTHDRLPTGLTTDTHTTRFVPSPISDTPLHTPPDACHAGRTLHAHTFSFQHTCRAALRPPPTLRLARARWVYTRALSHATGACDYHSSHLPDVFYAVSRV